jgi:hypothetical protein
VLGKGRCDPASDRLHAFPTSPHVSEPADARPKIRRLDEPIAVSLEALIPADQFYRHLEAKLDLGFVRDWTQSLYAERGRLSISKLCLTRFSGGSRVVDGPLQRGVSSPAPSALRRATCF